MLKVSTANLLVNPWSPWSIYFTVKWKYMKIYENKRYISLKNKHYQTEECYFRKYCTLLCKSYSTAKLLQLKVATNAWKKTYWDPIFGRLHFFLASFDCYQFFFYFFFLQVRLLYTFSADWRWNRLRGFSQS